MAQSKPTLILAILFLNVACPTAHKPIRRASVSAEGMIEVQSGSFSELAKVLADDPEAPAVANSLLALAEAGTPQETLLPFVRNLKSQIEPWHENATKLLKASIEEVKQCAVAMDGALGQLQGKKDECSANGESQSLIQLVEASNCRTVESTKFTTMETWKVQAAEKKEIMDTECKEFEDIKAEARAATAKYSSGDAGAYLESVSTMICDDPTGLLPRYRAAKNNCEAAQAKHTDADGKWETATTAHTETKTQCNGVQKKKDNECCKYAIDTKEACTSHDTCYDDKVDKYNNLKALIQSEEKVAKVEWRVYSRIECLLPVLGTDDAAKIEECRAHAHGTAHLDIDYPEIPAKSPCFIEAAYPGTAAYYTARYGSLPVGAQAQDVAVCAGMATDSAIAVASHVPQSASDYCAAECKAAGFCCNDWTKGSNQMISCAQACMMRSKGSQTSEMTAANNGICKRTGQSGCSLTVNGDSYGFCSSCADLTSDSKCSWGVSSAAACDFGAALSPPGVEEAPAAPIVTMEKQPMGTGGGGTSCSISVPKENKFGNGCIWNDAFCVNKYNQCGIKETEVDAKCGQWDECAGVVCSADYGGYCLARGKMDPSSNKANMWAYVKVSE